MVLLHDVLVFESSMSLILGPDASNVRDLASALPDTLIILVLGWYTSSLTYGIETFRDAFVS